MIMISSSVGTCAVTGERIENGVSVDGAHWIGLEGLAKLILHLEFSTSLNLPPEDEFKKSMEVASIEESSKHLFDFIKKDEELPGGDEPTPGELAKAISSRTPIGLVSIKNTYKTSEKDSEEVIADFAKALSQYNQETFTREDMKNIVNIFWDRFKNKNAMFKPIASKMVVFTPSQFTSLLEDVRKSRENIESGKVSVC